MYECLEDRQQSKVMVWISQALTNVQQSIDEDRHNFVLIIDELWISLVRTMKNHVEQLIRCTLVAKGNGYLF